MRPGQKEAEPRSEERKVPGRRGRRHELDPVRDGFKKAPVRQDTNQQRAQYTQRCREGGVRDLQGGIHTGKLIGSCKIRRPGKSDQGM